ncbi:hypothetical protein ACFOOM_07660 [Streptomyces echinoruber]|uniref:Uncharacterized protein n=1 Tax=Streptomyces echinoruber TaxID=68898 RepID=A0A918QZR2_9ACTN|nr:hypothetical protein [Streptomyces echinoruber]GGZ80332.1 hypothetical protein GCM10010389_17700 [Streptomyces echinoruber]
MRTEDVLAQIDRALTDCTVSPDAMRCRPAEEPPAAAPPRPVAVPTAGREFLVRRLVDRHGLTRAAALRAVLAAERGTSTEHAEAVQAEVRALAGEMMQRLRDAFRPLVASWAAAMQRLVDAAQHLQATASKGQPVRRRPDRPAWQSPYGPPLKRR